MTMADEQGPELTARMRAIREIFDREIAQAEYDIEPSAHIAWMKGLRDEVCDGAPRYVPAWMKVGENGLLVSNPEGVRNA